jgi:hypothetical protein
MHVIFHPKEQYMRKFLQTLLVVIALMTGLGAARAQDNLDYYWVQDSGNWYDLSNWRVFSPATDAVPAAYVIPTELPDGTNRVFINGTLPLGITPLFITGSLVPNTINISISAPVAAGTGGGGVAVRSISFGGTISPNTTVNFLVDQPLTVGEYLTADYPVVVRTGDNLTVNGALTLNAAGSGLVVNQPLTVAGALTVNAPAAITANSTLQAGSLAVNAAASLTVSGGGSLQVTNATAGLTFGTGATGAVLTADGPVNVAGTLTVNAPTTITANSSFAANAVTYNASPANASPAITTANTRLTLAQTATITNAFTISAPITVQANGALQAGSVAVNAGASLTVGAAPVTANPAASLTVGATGLSFGTGATGAVMTASGPVTVNGPVSVSAPTTITANHNFSATSLTYNAFSTATTANTRLTFGDPAPQANTRVIISGAVAINAAVAITANNTLTIGTNVRFETGATGVVLAINRPVSVGGSFTLAGPNNITGNAATGSLTFTSTAANTTITSANAVYNVPVIFNGLAANGTTRGRWILQDAMTIRVSAEFLNGHVVALPLSAANASPFNPNAAVPLTEPTASVSSPMMIFQTNDGVTPRIYATALGATSASHVIGYVRKMQVQKSTFEVPGRETSFTFPIGDGTYYRPLTMFEPSSAVADWTARYLSVNPVTSSGISPSRHNYDAPLQRPVSDKEFWYLTASASANTRMRMSYMHPNPAIVQSNYYRVDKWQGLTIAGLSTNSNNATWKDINGTPTFPGPNGGTISTNNAMGSSAWFTIGRRDQTPLPVHLVSFSAQYVDGQVQLKWQSSAEENTSHFEVEKSADGKNFTPVLTKKAQGNSSSLVSYNATHNRPYNGTSYYRLKMVDLDGTFEYSKLAVVSAEATLVVRAYPNPSKGNGVNIITNNGSKLVLKSVSDLFGKQVGYQAEGTAEGLQVRFPQPLPAGFYVATLLDSDNGQLVRVKFVVQ